MMKLLYDATNGIEAQLILDLLKDEGLDARIDGEHLQGGIGELPAMGLIRVMIDERDFASGRAIIDEWNSSRPQQGSDEERGGNDGSAEPRRSPFLMGLIGFFCGIIAMTAYDHFSFGKSPITEDGIDFNGDGKADEIYFFEDYKIVKVEQDRNFDGTADIVYLFDRWESPSAEESDNNSDGVFETSVSYKNGNPATQFSDTTGDGIKDFRVDFDNGILSTITFLHPQSRKPIKIQHFDAFKIQRAELDTDANGELDTVYEFDTDGVVTIVKPADLRDAGE